MITDPLSRYEYEVLTKMYDRLGLDFMGDLWGLWASLHLANRNRKQMDSLDIQEMQVLHKMIRIEGYDIRRSGGQWLLERQAKLVRTMVKEARNEKEAIVWSIREG